jgi:hypothetical protein
MNNFHYAVDQLQPSIYEALAKCFLEHAELELTSTGTFAAVLSTVIRFITEAQELKSTAIDPNLLVKFIALSVIQDWKDLDPEIQKHLTLIAFKNIKLEIN